MGRELRVLHAIGSLNQGGSQSFVMNLYRAIDRSRIQFDFIVEHPDEQYYANEIKELGGKIYELHPFYGINTVSYRRQWRDLFTQNKDWVAIHSHVRSTASLYLPIAKKNGLATIIHSHSTSESSGFKGLVKRMFEFPLRYVADYHFACSEESARWLYGDRLVDQGMATIIPNAIDSSAFAFSNIVRKEVRRELHLGGEPLFGNVGRLAEPKNHIFILEIFRNILELNPESKLILIGDGELRGSIERAIFENNLTESVMMLGSRSDVWRLYQAMDVLIMPSLYEGFPVTLVESQAASLPAVISDTITGEANIVDDLICRLSLSSDPETWAKACVGCLNQVRKPTTEKIVSSGFDVKNCAERLLNFYLSLIKDQK